MRILFSMRNLWYIRIFESVIRELAARGHRIHIAAEGGQGRERAKDWNDAADVLVAENANVTVGWVPGAVADVWVDLRISVHLGLDYLRFLRPQYLSAPMLLERARERAPGAVVWASRLPLVRTAWGVRALTAVLRMAERAIPFNPALAEYLRKERAEIILITPLVTLGSEQQDVLRIARRTGVPSVLCVGSWDHLSSKALVREHPDRVLVWNETQRNEAVSLHQVPAANVTVTGAQCFDQWFDRPPTLERAAFLRKVGLEPNRPYIAYVCSALFAGSPNEAEFVARWVAAVRASPDPALASAGILVRQHPKRGSEWDDVSLAGHENVVLWPSRATAPFRDDTKSDYFDSLFHSAAVVGLNTSALIEAGIVGRPVHTLLLPEFQQNQEGTLHFRYLLDQGLLQSTRSLDAHVEQLAGSLSRAGLSDHHNRDFVLKFVRPHGLDVSATQTFANAVEQAALQGTVVQVTPWWVPMVRAVLRPLARRTVGAFAEHVNRDRRRAQKALAREARRASAAEIRDERRAATRSRREAEAAAERALALSEKRRSREMKRRARQIRLEEWRRSKQRT